MQPAKEQSLANILPTGSLLKDCKDIFPQTSQFCPQLIAHYCLAH